MKRLLYVLALVIGSYTVHAQSENDSKFVFQQPFEDVDYAQLGDLYMGNSPLGENIEKGMEVMKLEYTFKPDPTPMSPNPGIEVEKPTIYYSVKKVYKHYKKAVKKGDVELTAAQNRLNEVIKIGVNIRYMNTEKLEEALTRAKQAEEIESVFAKVEYDK